MPLIIATKQKYIRNSTGSMKYQHGKIIQLCLEVERVIWKLNEKPWFLMETICYNDGNSVQIHYSFKKVPTGFFFFFWLDVVWSSMGKINYKKYQLVSDKIGENLV